MSRDFLKNSFWNGLEPFIGLHPFLSPADREAQAACLNPERVSLFSDQKSFFFLTSGTSRQARWVVLSRQALFHSAESVNAHLQVSSSDHWFCSLPTFHVGGLGIFARAYVAGIAVSSFPSSFSSSSWNALEFTRQCEASRATLCSLVPTQVYDLVVSELACPASLRAVLVGGAALSSFLYLAARRLGWPLLPTYGMTEAASQIATASLQSLDSLTEKEWIFPDLDILSHWEVQSNEINDLSIRGRSLFSAFVTPEGIVRPVLEEAGWWKTGDQVLLSPISNRRLRRVTRAGDWIKIRGEKVNLAELRSRWEKAQWETGYRGETWLTVFPHPRLGKQLVLLHDPQSGTEIHFEEAVKAYQSQSAGMERIQTQIPVPQLASHRTALGKEPSFDVLRERLGVQEMDF